MILIVSKDYIVKQNKYQSKIKKNSNKNTTKVTLDQK